jgi:anti-sigma factor RsiW
LLAAYVDGELDAAARHEVEDWLALHPEAAAGVEAQRSLLGLWQDTIPPEPSEARWQTVFSRVAAALLLPRHGPMGGRRAGVWVAAMVAAAVAAVFAGSWMLHRPDGPLVPEVPQAAGEAVELLSVVSLDDIEIISIDGDDEDTLVVGEPPVRGPIVLAATGDVTLEAVQADARRLPGVQMKEGAIGPMLVVPLETAAGPVRGD